VNKKEQLDKKGWRRRRRRKRKKMKNLSTGVS
jgi:hypothetical protein